MGGKGEVKGQRTMEKAGDLQRGERERQGTKEVREPGGQCRGSEEGTAGGGHRSVGMARACLPRGTGPAPVSSGWVKHSGGW